MPRVTDLMEVGFNSLQAKHLGAQAETGNFNNLTATGNNSQVDAYQLIANYNIFTTVGATTNSCKLPEAESDPHGNYYILNLGANSLYLFPAVGDSFNDLSANTAIEIPTGTGVILVKQTITSWQVQATFGSNSPDLSGYVPYTGATGNVDLGAFGITGSYLRALGTTEQFRLSYDAGNYLTTTISSDGTTQLITASSVLNGGGYRITATTGIANSNGGSMVLAGGTGGATTNVIGGSGGGFALSSGAGGTNTITSGLVSSPTNTGGAFSLIAGNGGAVTVNGGTIIFVPATGGSFGMNAGAGGTVTNNIAGASSGSIGGTLNISSGTGGTATASPAKAFTITGGAGGGMTYNLGAGGTSSNSTTLNIGGAGGAFTLSGGTGGTANGSGNNTGGLGSALTLTSGQGGNPTVVASFTATGGKGGDISLIANGGRNVSGTNAIGGASGIMSFQVRSGGTGTATNGTDGYIKFDSATSTGGSVTERMRMTTGGNFGFGITAPTAVIHLKAGTATASTSPLKYTSGTLLSVAEIGAQEFLTDKYYCTITTGTARKEYTLNDIALTSGRVPFTTTNGRLTDSANLTFSGSNLTVSGTISASNLGVRTSFTPSDLTPTAGTVTGGTKTGWYLRVGDMIYFQASYVGFTQNTSTSTQYTASLPITGVSNIAAVPFTGYDASTGLMLTRCASSSSTQYILDRSGDWTAGQSVNLYISGYYYVN